MDDFRPRREQLRETEIRIEKLQSEIDDLEQRLADRQRRLTQAREEIAELRQRNIRLENDTRLKGPGISRRPGQERQLVGQVGGRRSDRPFNLRTFATVRGTLLHPQSL